MNGPVDTIKKVGAGLIVLILIGMMGITFSSQPISEITAILSGQSGPGEFEGKEISRAMVNLALNQCKERYRSFGEIPDYFLNNCIENELKNLIVLPALGRKLGLDVPDSKVQKELMEAVESRYRSQSGYADPDDRLDMREIYNRELQFNPLDVRKAIEATRSTYESLRDFPVSPDMKQASVATDGISMNIRYIQYSTSDLLKSLGKEVVVSEEEIREAYEKEQAEKKDEEKRPLEKERELIENRIRSEKRQVELAGLKSQLGALGETFELKKVSEITGISIESAGRVVLKKLKQVPAKKGAPLDLAKPEILAGIPAPGSSLVAGPFTSGDQTYYVEIGDVRISDTPVLAEKIESETSNQGVYHAAYLLEQLVENESKRGNFKVYLKKDEDS